MGCGASTKSTKDSLQTDNQKTVAEPVDEREDEINERKLQQSSNDQTNRQSNSPLSTNTDRSSKNGREPSEHGQTPHSIHRLSPSSTRSPSPVDDADDPVVDDGAPSNIALPEVPDSNANNQSNSKPHSSLSQRKDGTFSKASSTSAPSEKAKSNKSETRPSTRPTIRPSTHGSTKSSSSLASELPPVDGRNTGNRSKSITRQDGTLSVSLHDHPRCPYCQHCRQMKSGRIPSAQKLPWIMGPQVTKDFVIDMDEYDVDAVTKQIIEENGRIPGAYDYQPYLTIEEVQNNENNNGTYYKLPFVARKGTRITPTHTPFPNYDLLQTREQRPNKPFEVQLFSD